MNAIIVVGGSNVGVRAASGYSVAESCRSTDAHGAISVYSRELGCRLDRRFMRLKAASAVEARRRQPHFIPVCVVAIGKRLLLPFRGSDQLLISQNADGSLHIGIMGPEKRRVRLCAMLNRQQSARHEREKDPEEVLLGVLLVGRELVIRVVLRIYGQPSSQMPS